MLLQMLRPLMEKTQRQELLEEVRKKGLLLEMGR